MARKRSLVPKENLDVYVPKTLAAQVRERLYDPRLGSTGYGKVSELVTKLLSDWVARTPLNPMTEQAKQKELANELAKL